jgi:putative transposase
MQAVLGASATIGVASACKALKFPRATYYRRLEPKPPRAPRPSPRALPPDERKQVLEVLHEPRFADQPPAEVYAQLLEEGKYLCSERTMYRILAANAEVRERRNQIRHRNHPVPRLEATAPRQLWSWDISKIAGPFKGTWYHLYVLLDVYSRFVVGWMIAHREHARLAKRLIEVSCKREGITPGELTIHADHGPAMISKPVAFLMGDLGITKSHSRPHVSDDNPYSEAQFKTLKYRPDFPEAFESIHHARSFLHDFFRWYNYEHHHSGLALFTPADVHQGRIDQVIACRKVALDQIFEAHPERFPNGRPVAKRPPDAAWINRPQSAPALHSGEPGGQSAAAVNAGVAAEPSGEGSIDGTEHCPMITFSGGGCAEPPSQEVALVP